MNRYLRTIHGLAAHGGGHVNADVYAVLAAFGVTCPATAHAVKKLLAAGLRGHKTRLGDLEEARVAIDRAIEDERRRCRERDEGKSQ